MKTGFFEKREKKNRRAAILVPPVIVINGVGYHFRCGLDSFRYEGYKRCRQPGAAVVDLLFV
jgi:hypothetical protein